MIKENENMNIGTSPAIAANPSYAQPNICLYNADNKDVLSTLADGGVDVILTDPPYLYLKNQKLEREFDEELFFSECRRVLKKNGFIILFGRGESFYRCNTKLSDLGFKFKEEIIWKKQPTSPAMAIGRIHETISIYSKNKGKINRVRVPFFDKYKHEPDKILEVVKRIKTTFGNRDTFRQLEQYYATGKLEYYSSHNGYGVSLSADNRKTVNRTVQFARGLEEGITEQTIIEETRDHYNTIHPTQKPVRLLERLLNLVVSNEESKNSVVVLDPFGGSFSTMEAVHNLGLNGISCEIDKEYFEAGKKRIESLPPRQTALFD